MKQDEVISRLKKGNQNYTETNLKSELKKEKMDELVGGQSPWAIVLGCADSRVIPEQVFDATLGELFTVRVAGNIANASSIASIEYAVANLGTQVIVVLGHENCGAVTAAVKGGGDASPSLKHLVEHIEPAVKKASSEEINDVVQTNVAVTVNQLRKDSKIISEAVDSGKLKIVPAYYHLDGGKVDFLD